MIWVIAGLFVAYLAGEAFGYGHWRANEAHYLETIANLRDDLDEANTDRDTRRALFDEVLAIADDQAARLQRDTPVYSNWDGDGFAIHRPKVMEAP